MNCEVHAPMKNFEFPALKNANSRILMQVFSFRLFMITLIADN